MTKSNVETIKLFKDGEWKEYKRDLNEKPLNIEDFFNANKLDVAVHNYQRQMVDDNKDMKTSAVKPYIEANLKFIVTFFRDQFTLEDAKGISPKVMHGDADNWYAMSAGVMGSLDTETKK